MKLVCFDDYRLGVLSGDGVVDITDLVTDVPEAWKPLKMIRLIENFDALRGQIEKAAQSGPAAPLDSVKLLAPLPRPGKVMAAPSNYMRHVREMVAEDSPLAKIGLFLKASSAVTGPSQPIVLPYADRRTDHESELVMVIGKRASKVSAGDALDHVFGYTCGLDITVRGDEDRSQRKSFDSFSPLGPCIVTADEVPDPQALEINLWVNDDHRQHAFTKDMREDCRNIIERMSAVMTMEPGDVIFTGTPEGVGPLAPGDTVRINIEKVGEMAVAVVAS